MDETNGFEPKILAFCCNWCSYTGADLAGTSRLQYPPNVRIIRVMCSGMVHPNMVIEALTKGADGVMICGCHPGDCHYLEGNLRGRKNGPRRSISYWRTSASNLNGFAWSGSPPPRDRALPRS